MFETDRLLELWCCSAPMIGLVVGGMIAARGAPAEGRWRRGALVTLPYAAMALLTALTALGVLV